MASGMRRSKQTGLAVPSPPLGRSSLMERPTMTAPHDTTTTEATTIGTFETGKGSEFHDAEQLAAGFVGAAITTRTLDVLPKAHARWSIAPSVRGWPTSSTLTHWPRRPRC
jgi:hypothetical protein